MGKDFFRFPSTHDFTRLDELLPEAAGASQANVPRSAVAALLA